MVTLERMLFTKVTITDGVVVLVVVVVLVLVVVVVLVLVVVVGLVFLVVVLVDMVPRILFVCSQN